MRLPAPEFWIHHSVTNPTSSPAADARTIQQVAFGRGFSDISYSYLVHPDGTVLEGRGLRVGAHTKGRNSIALALCFIGNYSTRQPTDTQMESARWLIQHLKDTGALKPDAPLQGHRQNPASPSECPGNLLYPRLGELRQAPTQEDDLSEASDTIIAKLNDLGSRVGHLERVLDRELNMDGMAAKEELDELRRSARGPAAVAVLALFQTYGVAVATTTETAWQRCSRIADEVVTGKRTWANVEESIARIAAAERA